MTAMRSSLPDGLPDKRAHCLVSAWIAQRCSVFEAYVAGIGKEVTDAFDGGDPDWSDWQADRAGVRCAKQDASSDAIVSCCAKRGY